MIVSHYVSEPVALPPRQGRVSPLHTGSELFTRLSKVWRVIRRGRVFDFPFPRSRQPFQRLEFWTASHPLSFKLRLYSVSEPKVDMWRGFTWETLRYWQDLMSGEETTRIDAEAASSFVDWLGEPARPEMERLAHAEPFAD